MQAFERWSTERLRAKRKNNSPFELEAIEAVKQQLTRSSRDLKIPASVAVPFTQQDQAPRTNDMYQENRITSIRLSQMICSQSAGNPCKLKDCREGTGKEVWK